MLLKNILLFLHSWNRWFILGLLILVLVQAWQGWKQNRSYSSANRRNTGILVGLQHLQLLLGLVLYVLVYVPYWQAAGMGIMKDSLVRFFAVEHTLLMIVALVVAQLGSIKAKKAGTDTAKHKTTFTFFTISAGLMLLSLLPGLMTGKMAWFRGF